MAAGSTGLNQVFTAEAAAELHARGDALRDRLQNVGEAARIPLQVNGIGSLMFLHFQREPVRRPADVRTPENLRKLVHLNLLNRGFQIARRGYITLSLPVTDEDCERLVAAFDGMLNDISPYFGLLEFRPA